MRRLFPASALALSVAAALAGGASAQEADQTVLTRSLLEAMRQNTAALQKTSADLQTLANRLERVEAAIRTVPPGIESARTDIIAMRAGLDRLTQNGGIRRAAATLRFSAFACGNESGASCAANACKSVGYGAGVPVRVTVTGTGANAVPTSVEEATCYD